MKCPKCGSKLDTGFNCPKCGYKRYEQADIQPELTTAEMLLLLAPVLDILRNLVLTKIVDDKPVFYSYKEAWERLWASLTKEKKRQSKNAT